MDRRNWFKSVLNGVWGLAGLSLVIPAVKADDYWIPFHNTITLDNGSRVFYIDISHLPQKNAEIFMEKLKVEFAKRKNGEVV
jgi:hypothetical protein